MDVVLLETIDTVSDKGRQVTVYVYQEYRSGSPNMHDLNPKPVPVPFKTLRTEDGQEVAGGTREGDLWIPETGEKLTPVDGE